MLETPCRGDRHRADQQEAGVRHRRVGDHPLDVGLGEAEHRADHHRRRSRRPTARRATPSGWRRTPRAAPAGCAPNAATFVQARHERGDRASARPGRRPGVQVWNGPTEPLNSRPTTSSASPPNSSVSDRAEPADARRDVGEPHRARVAVEQREAVEEERRGERAEQEVLDRRLLRQQPAAPGQPAHQVQRQAQHLERDEHRQQVVRRDEGHHPAEREQREREDLGLHRRRLVRGAVRAVGVGRVAR